MKWWWNKELVDRCREVRRVAQHVYKRRAHPHDPVHKILKAKRSTYVSMIKHAKRVHWEEFLSLLDEKTVWTAHKYVSGELTDGGKMRIPTLKAKQPNGCTWSTETNADKSRALQEAFFLEPVADRAQQDEHCYPAPKFQYEPISNTQIQHIISQLGPYKAVGPDGITSIVFIRCADLLVPHLGPIYRATFSLGAYPKQWKDSITVMLRKPMKPDYTLLNTH